MFARFQVRWPVCVFVLCCLNAIYGTHQARAQQQLSDTSLTSDGRPVHLVVLRFSEDLLTRQMNGRTDLLLPVRDVILNTPVTGTARLVADPKVDLQPSEGLARFRVSYSGTIASRTVGQNGPATIYSRSVTWFTATKDVVFEPGKGFSSGPPQVQTRTQCFTDGVRINRGGIIGRIIQRRAHEQIAASRPTVTAIARQRAVTRITAEFDKHMDARLARLNQSIELQTKLAELRIREGNRRLTARTTPEYLEIADTIFADNSPVSRAELTGLSQAAGPVQIWVHSSIVPPKVAQALETMFTCPDESAVINALALLPGMLGKKAAAVITAVAAENKVHIHNSGSWFIVDLHTASPTSQIATAPLPSASAINTLQR